MGTVQKIWANTHLFTDGRISENISVKAITFILRHLFFLFFGFLVKTMSVLRGRVLFSLDEGHNGYFKKLRICDCFKNVNKLVTNEMFPGKIMNKFFFGGEPFVSDIFTCLK